MRFGGTGDPKRARGLYTLNEIRFDLPRPQFPPYPAFAPFLPALLAHAASPLPPLPTPTAYCSSPSCCSSSAGAKTGLGWFARQAEFEKIRFTRQPSQPGAQTRPYRGWLHQGGKFSVLTSSPDRILIRRRRQLEQCLAGLLRKSSVSASSQRGGEGEAGTSWGEDKMGRAGGTETRPH